MRALREMMEKLSKTNACRALDQLRVAYTLRSYEVDSSDLSAEHVAAKIGFPPARVYKTLCVVADDRAVLLAVVAGHRELDLKKLASSAHKRSVQPVPLKDLTALTGYVRGGVTALACKKPYPVFVDGGVLAHETISVSAGRRGLQILVRPADYVRATSATLAELERDKTL
jgi:Cys-tRNA(Pro)/Cys-tRNA(Cys) deacylase